jgi:hypothetical protein
VKASKQSQQGEQQRSYQPIKDLYTMKPITSTKNKAGKNHNAPLSGTSTLFGPN